MLSYRYFLTTKQTSGNLKFKNEPGFYTAILGSDERNIFYKTVKKSLSIYFCIYGLQLLRIQQSPLSFVDMFCRLKYFFSKKIAIITIYKYLVYLGYSVQYHELGTYAQFRSSFKVGLNLFNCRNIYMQDSQTNSTILVSTIRIQL